MKETGRIIPTEMKRRKRGKEESSKSVGSRVGPTIIKKSKLVFLLPPFNYYLKIDFKLVFEYQLQGAERINKRRKPRNKEKSEGLVVV